MLNDPVKHAMESKKLLTAAPETTVYEASRLMSKRKVGALLVVNGETLVGIFTERDALYRVIAKGLDVRTTPIADVMTKDVITAHPGETFGHALLLMHEHGFRHVPVVEHGKLVGIVSARIALDPDLEDFVAEERRRKHVLRSRNR
jgi:CBS domain-containing protein